MRLDLNGVIDTGVTLLDSGITDISAAVVNGEVHIFSTTGRNGGLAGYTLASNGSISVTTTLIYPPSITLRVGDHLVFSDDGAGPVLHVGSNGQGLFGYSVGANGLGGYIQQSWSNLQSMAANGGYDTVEGLILLSEQSPDLFPADFDCTQVVDMVSVTINGQDFILTACALNDEISAFRVDSSGALVETGVMGALQGLGINNPTAMSLAQVGGQTFVIVAASGTSSISVLRVMPDGSLVPVDHVLDNGTTRFEGVQDLAVAQSGDHVFVVAGGSDSGLSLFLLLPDGTLVHLQTIADSDSTSMNRVTAIEVVVDGDVLHVFIGSQNDDGLTHFSLDLTTLGALQMGHATSAVLRGGGGDDILIAVGHGDDLLGGGGDDVLVAGRGNTDMTGGAGADIFVIGDGSGASAVLDFQRGQDRLDLSGMPMLRDVSQLTITTTANGARIEYRGHVITITSADGRPLTADDLFPGGLEGGDHFDYYPPDPPPPDPPDPDSPFAPPNPLPDDPEMRPLVDIPDPVPPGGLRPGDLFEGSGIGDLLRGGARDDTLRGFSGNDLLDGRRGHDLLFGAAGRDTLYGGDGDDQLLGGGGNDTLSGGGGRDLLEGGGGHDRLSGKWGNDTIDAGAGRDTVFGGAGDDVISASTGRNHIDAGTGDDRVQGGNMKDVIFGGAGSDTVFGGAGSDAIGGGSGNDFLFGEAGNDTIYGKIGDDWLDGGSGSDRLWGGGGNDVLLGGGGGDQLHGARGNDSLLGGDGNDAIWGDNDDDLIKGGAGNDWLSGGSGNDYLFGGSGNDTFRGGTGIDVFWGGSGADVFEFFSDHDTGWIMDFDTAEGDILRLDDAMWAALGSLTPQEVVDRFGYIDDAGNLVLDFTDYGGAVIILSDYDDLDGLADSIVIM